MPTVPFAPPLPRTPACDGGSPAARGAALLALLPVMLLGCSDTVDQVHTNLEKKFGTRLPPILEINTTPIKGVYEVVVGDQMQPDIYYTNAQTDYIILKGQMVDLQNPDKPRNLLAETHRRLQAGLVPTRTDFATLPFDQAIRVIYGKGTHKIAVFSDPDCLFCQRLERESLPQSGDLTMYVFLYPLTQLHSEAEQKANLIWCSPDRAAAWQNWMLNGKLPAATKKQQLCSTPIRSLRDLGMRLRVQATPTLIFEDGTIVAGALPAEELRARLASAAVPVARGTSTEGIAASTP